MMYFLTIWTFIAHLHPALVHLPIGILLAALLLQLVSRQEKFAGFRPAIPVILLAGLVSAVVSCVTGFLLYRSGDYDETLVSAHMWLAIGLTFVSFALYARAAFGGTVLRLFDRNGSFLGIGLFLLIIIVGHLGGSLTHGEGYLSLSTGNAAFAPVFHPIADVQQAAAYEDLVKPILASRCNNCHGANRQKGGLRLDGPEWIVKGGKDGVMLVAGKADSSELIKRLKLPDNDEHHMPPKDRPQLSAQEQLILSWWVDQGADYRKQVKDLAQTEKVKSALADIQKISVSGGGETLARAGEIVPESAVGAADEKDLDTLRKAGAVVTAMAENSHYLAVDLSEVKGVVPVALLLPLKKQLIHLSLSGTGVGDSAMAIVGQCKVLRVINLSGTRITDKSLTALAALPELRILNLVGTNVTGPGLLGVQPPKHLQALFLYHTKVEEKDRVKLVALYKHVELDFGGYTLPVLASDTTVVKAAINK